MKFFKLFFCLLLVLTTTWSALAQEADSKGKAIVYYRDGSVFIGPIVQENFRYLTMVIATSDTIQVEKGLAKKVLRASENISIQARGRYYYSKGTFASLTIGGGGGGDNSSRLDLLVGHRLNDKVSIALGTGLHYNSFFFGNFWADAQFIPLYGYGRYYLGRKNARPYVFGAVGHGFPTGTLFFGDFTGGFSSEAGIGLHWASRKKIRWVLTLSQSTQHVRGMANNIDLFNNPVTYDYNLWLNRIIFKLGIEFR